MMVRAIVHNLLGRLATDMQSQAHLIYAGSVDIDELPYACACAGRTRTWSWHTTQVWWWRFTDNSDINFLAIAQLSSHVQCDKVSIWQRPTCRLQQLIDTCARWQRIHSWVLYSSYDVNLNITPLINRGATSGGVRRDTGGIRRERCSADVLLSNTRRGGWRRAWGP